MAQEPNSAKSDARNSITLDLLTAIKEDSKITQRSLSEQLGIALGLTNSYLKRCVKKGLIKISMAPANRYAYYLTPQGLAEKSRLTKDYLTNSFQFYRVARLNCDDVYDACLAKNRRRILLAGPSDLGEIATLCANNKTVSLMGVFTMEAREDNFNGLPVFTTLPQPSEFDAIMITDLNDPAGYYRALAQQVDPSLLVAPSLLGDISTSEPELEED